MKNIRLLIIIFASLTVILLYFIFKNINKQEDTLTFAPGYVTIKVNDKIFKKTKCNEKLCQIKIPKNADTISLEKQNFKTVSDDLKNNSDNQLFLISSPENSAGTEQYNDDKLLQTQIQNASSEQFSYGSKKIAEKYPFLDQLNIYGSGFTVGYGQPSYSNRDQYDVALYIDAQTPNYRLNAIDSIIDELGVSPSEIEVIYNDFNNPFMVNK
jgi:hypothetical protein